MIRLDPSETIPRLTTAISQGDVVFLVGAGISMNPGSCLPGWADMVKGILQHLAGSDGQDELALVHRHMDLLFNEVLFRLSMEYIGSDLTVKALNACLGTPSYNLLHRFLAWTTATLGTRILTTNFDGLITKAGAMPDYLLELHGSLSEPASLRFTDEHIFGPVDKEKASKAKAWLEGKIVLVAGYSGRDEFDIMPLVFDQEAKCRECIWLVHGTPPLDDVVKPHLEKAHFSTCWFNHDTESFFKICSARLMAESPSKGDEDLQAWKVQHECNMPGWWKAGLEQWSEVIWQTEKESATRFLWARILDHVRCYQEKKGRTEYNPTEEAYQRFLKCKSPVPPVKRLEARSRIAYVLRTTGSYKLDQFRELVDEIRSELIKTQEADERKSLQRLLGWTVHQYGNALQGAGKHFEAKLVLEEAARIRAMNGDDDVANSVFQLFMNGHVAETYQRGHLDDFAPNGWRQWLSEYLGNFAKQFHGQKPESYGTTCQNIGMVSQVKAFESFQAGAVDEALDQFQTALGWYRKARDVRIRLRDLRMVAQSDIRIGQCLVVPTEQVFENGDRQKGVALVKELEECVNEVHRIYAGIPQETHRSRDFESLLEDIKRIKEKYKVL